MFARTSKEDPLLMAETKRHDPLRREPPTVDLKPTEFQRTADGAPETSPSPADAGTADAGTAIEPIASTGLDGPQAPPRAADRKPSAPDAPGGRPPSGAGVPPVGAKPAGTVAAGSAPRVAGVATGSANPPPFPNGGSPAQAAAGTSTSPGPKASGPSGAPMPPSKPSEPAQASVPPVAAAASGVVPAPASGAAATSAASSTASATSGAARPTAGASKPIPPAASAASAGSSDGREKPPVAEPKAADPVQPAAARPGPGLGRLIGSGIVGGIVGAVLATGASRYLGSDGTETRIAALEQRPSAPPAVPAGLGELQRRVASLGDEVTAIRGTADAAGRQASAAANRPAPAAPPDNAAALDALTSRIAPLEAALGRVPQLEEIASRLTPLEDAARRAGEQAGAVRDLGGRLDAAAARSAEATEGNAAGLRQAQAALQAAQAGVQALQGRASEQEAKLATTAAELARLSPAAVQAGLRVVVAGRLDEAFRTGAALGPALGAIEKLGGAPDQVAALRSLSGSPPPAPGALAAAFKPLAERMTAVPNTPADSLGDRLLRIAEKVVTVRAIGDGSGSDVPGLVARIEAAVGRGSLADAATAWDALPAEPKAISADWAAGLKRRVAAEEAVRRIGAESLAALDAATR